MISDENTLTTLTTNGTTKSPINTGTTSSSKSTSSSSRKKKNARRQQPNKASEEEVAAVRHMRLVVESIALDKSLSENKKAERIATFRCISENVEKRLHYNPNKKAVLDAPPEFCSGGRRSKRIGAKNNNNHYATKNVGGKTSGAGKANKTGKRVSFFKHFVHDPKKIEMQTKTKQQQQQPDEKKYSGALEAHDKVGSNEAEEERDVNNVEERREDQTAEQREEHAVDAGVDGTVDAEGPESQQSERVEQMAEHGPMEAETVPQPEEEGEHADDDDDDDDATHTDSIIDARMANSEDYTASICSIRSISTFEKDFIKNIIAEEQQEEEAQYDAISVSTFEQDFAVRQQLQQAAENPSNLLPTQVVLSKENVVANGEEEDDFDDLTTDARSETTFEKDLRLKQGLVAVAAVSGNATVPPVQFVVSSVDMHQERQEDDQDDLTVDNENDTRSETTFEQDVAAKNQEEEEDNDNVTTGNLSETTFEKDAAAKIQVVRPQSRIVEPQSHFHPQSQQQPKYQQPPHSSSPHNNFILTTDETPHHPRQQHKINDPPVEIVFSQESERSVSTFEKDEAARTALAAKIGRVPIITTPTKLTTTTTTTKQQNNNYQRNHYRSPAAIEEEEEMSVSKFEREMVGRRRRGVGVVGGLPKNNPSDDVSNVSGTPSQNRFERDAKRIIDDPKVGNDELLGYERDVSRNMTHHVMHNRTHNNALLPSINEGGGSGTIVESSPYGATVSKSSQGKNNSNNKGGLFDGWLWAFGGQG